MYEARKRTGPISVRHVRQGTSCRACRSSLRVDYTHRSDSTLSRPPLFTFTRVQSTRGNTKRGLIQNWRFLVLSPHQVRWVTSTAAVVVGSPRSLHRGEYRKGYVGLGWAWMVWSGEALSTRNGSLEAHQNKRFGLATRGLQPISLCHEIRDDPYITTPRQVQQLQQ